MPNTSSLLKFLNSLFLIEPDWREVIRSFGLDVHLVGPSEDKPTPPADATRATVYRLNSTDFPF